MVMEVVFRMILEVRISMSILLFGLMMFWCIWLFSMIKWEVEEVLLNLFNDM